MRVTRLSRRSRSIARFRAVVVIQAPGLRGIPYRVPADAELPERLGGVLHVLYLIFNEGHVVTAGDELVRADL